MLCNVGLNEKKKWLAAPLLAKSRNAQIGFQKEHGD